MHSSTTVQHQTKPRRLAWFGFMALISLLATLVVSTGTAHGVSSCQMGDGADEGTAFIFVDEPSSSIATHIGMEEGELFVNGLPCGEPDEINIIDVGVNDVEKRDNIVIDLASPMRANNDEAQIFLFLDNQYRDRITVLGRNTQDYAILGPKNFVVARPTDYANSVEADDARVRLAMNWGNSRFDLRVELLGHNDTFDMVAHEGNYFSGVLTVLGGNGHDVLNGGPGKQKFFGGNGNDELNGAGGGDDLRGGRGADDISGGGGRDKIKGGNGRDSMEGGGGNDTFNARDRTRDTVDGGAGRDTCTKCDSIDRLTNVERT
jgi:hypothetical protein